MAETDFEKLIIRIGEQEFTVTPDGTEGALQFEGKSIPLDLVQLSPGTVSLIIEGRSYILGLEKSDNGEYTIRWTGGDIPLEVEDDRARLLKRVLGPAGSGKVIKSVKAPMPGMVVKLLVEKGAKVKKGQPLLVVEAMKMENEITAHADGTISDIKAAEGQAVEKNEILMVIE